MSKKINALYEWALTDETEITVEPSMLAALIEVYRVAVLVEVAAPTAIEGIAPHGIITAGTLLKLRAALEKVETLER